MQKSPVRDTHGYTRDMLRDTAMSRALIEACRKQMREKKRNI